VLTHSNFEKKLSARRCADGNVPVTTADRSRGFKAGQVPGCGLTLFVVVVGFTVHGIADLP